jgi:hypothetical protein
MIKIADCADLAIGPISRESTTQHRIPGREAATMVALEDAGPVVELRIAEATGIDALDRTVAVIGLEPLVSLASGRAF